MNLLRNGWPGGLEAGKDKDYNSTRVKDAGGGKNERRKKEKSLKGKKPK